MYQKLVIVGNLGSDPEMRYTSSGEAVTHFSVATSRKWTDRNNQVQQETVWFRVSVWGKQAEVCNQYLNKGRQVLVEGRLTAEKETGGPRIWTDQNGKARASYEVSAFEVRFLGTRADSGGGNFSGGGPGSGADDTLTEDEIPF